jgi:hypothetical protein
MAAQHTRMTQKTVLLQHIMAEHYTTCYLQPWWWVWELLNVPSYSQNLQKLPNNNYKGCGRKKSSTDLGTVLTFRGVA